MGELFEAVGMIGVAPSAPWNENDHSRWCLPESDGYLADVVLECKKRFNIDPNRVILMGHSMGGFGAYHQVQRQPDRFAAVISSAGSWTQAQWPVIRGTTLCIVHGIKDAEPKVRDRHTDIAFGRVAHKLLSEQEVPHVFLEHPGGHSFGYAKSHVEKFLRTHPDLRRDPFFPHVVVASPVGYQGGRSFPARDSRWVSLDASTGGTLEYDTLSTNGIGHSKDSPIEEWRKWELRHRKMEREGAMIEAINRGGNLIDVTATNVSRFTVWLHPKMVDFSAPIRITVNGEPRFTGEREPSLLTALESYERRKDWSLVYPAKVTVEVPGVAE